MAENRSGRSHDRGGVHRQEASPLPGVRRLGYRLRADNQLGLIRLDGPLSHPGHSWPGGWCRTPAVNAVGKRASSTLRPLSATIQEWVPAGRT